MLTLFLLTINIILHLGKEYIVLWDPLPARRLNARYTFLMKVSGATLNSMFVCVTQIKDHITSTNFDWGPLFD